MKSHFKKRFSEATKLRDEGNLSRSRQMLVELLEEDPTSTAILAVLGHVCWDMNLLQEAATIFERATQLSPSLEAVSLGLFHCLWDLGKRDQALEEIKRFMSISDSENYRAIIQEINKKLE